jgi:hypothetical protein
MKFMQKRIKSNGKSRQKDVLIAEMRQKLDLSQAVFAAILGVPRTLLTMAESKERQLPARAGELVTKMYAQFMELETGIQANYRSLETRLILNDLYKSEIPAMKAREKECRLKITRLSEELQEMKQREKDAENSIIVCTTFLRQTEEKGVKDAATGMQLKGWNLFKEAAYHRLTSCWAPAQVKLQAKIEALRAEARTLRRTRLTIMREHHPFKK